jgi:hypothetical protein
MDTRFLKVCTAWLPAELPKRLLRASGLPPALLLALFCAQGEACAAAALELANSSLPPLPASALDATHGLLPSRSDGSQSGLTFSYSNAASVLRPATGEHSAKPTPLNQQFGLGREFDSDLGAFSLGGAVGVARSENITTDYWAQGRAAQLAFGPQLGYRSDPHSHFAAEVVGSYLYSRNRWVGHTFIGWRDNDGCAVGPELWRLGTGLGRSNGGGFAIHDLRLKPLRIGFRAGLETRSPLGRRFIGGIDLSWDNP